MVCKLHVLVPRLPFSDKGKWPNPNMVLYFFELIVRELSIIVRSLKSHVMLQDHLIPCYNFGIIWRKYPSVSNVSRVFFGGYHFQQGFKRGCNASNARGKALASPTGDVPTSSKNLKWLTFALYTPSTKRFNKRPCLPRKWRKGSKFIVFRIHRIF